ncbi:MAG: glutamate racemase [Hyphomonadaceae bacterium]|nr:glutamate racemase [Hyphomonadaceae bacterium]
MVNGAQRVLVFDSGVGGLSVLDAIAASGRALELDYVADNAWLPYGLKSDAQLQQRVPALLTRLVEEWAPEAVVVACNTASTIALDPVRAALSVPVVGVVPPIKPAAALTRTGVIGLLATPATVQRAYTNDLIARFAGDKRIVRFGSAALVEAAERKLAGDDPGTAAITEAIDGLFGAPGGAEVDVVALACTHFPLLAAELAAAAPRSCVWMDSGEAIARRLTNVLTANEGQSRVRRVGFTNGDGARASVRAFERRGFSDFFHISDAPHFEVAPLAPTHTA